MENWTLILPKHTHTYTSAKTPGTASATEHGVSALIRLVLCQLYGVFFRIWLNLSTMTDNEVYTRIIMGYLQY